LFTRLLTDNQGRLLDVTETRALPVGPISGSHQDQGRHLPLPHLHGTRRSMRP
jgi:hypothetical protein